MKTSHTHINYRDLIPRQKGFVFKFVKKEDHFIHTFSEGDFLTTLGIDSDWIIGKTLFDFLPNEIAKQKNEFYEQAWRGTPVNYEGQVNGYFYIASLNPMVVNGQTVEVNGTAIDISTEKENEIKLRQMEKLSLVGELAAGIAHEIRNPLTSITGFTQIINESIQDPSLKGYLEIMLDELERINNIVSEFMFIAKPAEGFICKEINMGTLISSVLFFMKPQFNMNSVNITLDFDSSITAFCDPNQIKQVLINLLQNAVEATSTNKNIEISLKNESENYFSIKIKDYGSGISEERQKRLFEPFYTTKEKGTGLGLMVCKRIIENHRGTIDIQTQQGEGTDAIIILPKQLEK
ncbi:signal transduction histidine kinase [Bacillus sp. SLBN-46]|uniref:ATP-binding protein n=1 Tax=Bacillus sp. SLBN-46 TaxID=3042283 RepID=UPI002857FB77|nr:ATP-binding protein [Bacillus sp. SLBN-46]MDR6123406.1 signal transduction histidine kinase [Bacillus sp. SLBN-46]